MGYTMSFGAVSSGTMLTEDLLRTFSSELQTIIDKAEIGDDTTTVVELLGEYNERDGLDAEEADHLLYDVMDELDNWCPPHAYFGANEYDGACYGVWLGDISDLPKVNDASELAGLDAETDEAIVVNDHGNVTLYSNTSTGWEQVWAVV